jgi:hypothetical protein
MRLTCSPICTVHDCLLLITIGRHELLQTFHTLQNKHETCVGISDVVYTLLTDVGKIQEAVGRIMTPVKMLQNKYCAEHTLQRY